MQDSTEGDAREETESLIKRLYSEREKISTLGVYAEFRYRLTLNEVFLQHFPLIFVIKEAYFMRD